jgi:hypothetical protein
MSKGALAPCLNRTTAISEIALLHHIAGMVSSRAVKPVVGVDWYAKVSGRNWRFRLSEIFRMLSYFLFLSSLIAIAFPTQYAGYYGYYRGYEILMLGPLGLLWFSTNWPWLGNLALFAAWVSLAKRANITATLFSSAAAVAAARVFLVPTYMYDYESGMADKIEYLGPGYWFWSASMACALIAAFIRLNNGKPGFFEEDD